MNKKHRPIILVKRAGALAIAGLYLSVILLQGLHPVMDHHHSSSGQCMSGVETDPCHQRIYHHNSVAGCHHPEHVHTPIDDCELCDALVKKISFHEFSEVVFIAGINHFTQPRMTDQIVRRQPVRFISLRAPPELV